MAGFQAVLEELGTVPANQIPYYLRWVNLFLSRHGFIEEDISRESISSFINSLVSDNAPDWQIEQASNAVDIFFSRYRQVQLPDRILAWDRILSDYRSVLGQSGYSANTVKAYCRWCRQFSEYIHPVKPCRTGNNHLRDYISHLALDRKVAAQTQNQALKALSFMFSRILNIEVDPRISSIRAKTPKHLPLTLPVKDIKKLFDCMHGHNLLMVQLIYGSGLTLSECVSLRVRDIDFKENLIHVETGAVRDTLLPGPLKKILQKHLDSLAQLNRRDIANHVSVSYVPDETVDDPFDFGVQWLFPSDKISVNRLTGNLCRKHVFHTALQKAVKRAAVKAGIPSSHASANVLRHSFAVAMLDKVNIRELQELLGHKNIRNTLVYQQLQVKKAFEGIVSPVANLFKP